MLVVIDQEEINFQIIKSLSGIWEKDVSNCVSWFGIWDQVAKEQAERRETAQLMFDLGQKAYGRGMYGRAIEFLEGALTIIPRPTLFGGEVGLIFF